MSPNITQPYRMENWSVLTVGSYFNEHENKQQPFGYKLVGKVFGNPKHKDGTVVETSPIQAVDGRTVTTHSGSRYTVEVPSWTCRESMEFQEVSPMSVEDYLKKFVPRKKGNNS